MNEIDKITRRALSRKLFRHRVTVRNGVLLGLCLVSGLSLLGVLLFGPSLRPEDEQHDFYASRLWPGFRFQKEAAYLYKDAGHLLTWHVCTASGCGRYFEVEEDPRLGK